MSDRSAAQRSGYLPYLPGMLWNSDEDAASFSINVLLLIAEKILSGIDDEPVVHVGSGPAHTHDGIEAVLDRLHLLLDPHQAPHRFLPWLAGWVGIELSPAWDPHQQRRAIAGMVPALGLRGLHEGLGRSLDHYTVSAARPRITFDDGARILFTTPTPGRAAPVHTLLSHGPFLRDLPESDDIEAAYPGLTDPGCIAATPSGDLLLGDDGLPGNKPAVGPGIWRVSRTGGYVDTEGAPPRPHALGRQLEGQRLDRPRALVVEDRTDEWQAYVLDRTALYRLTSSDLDTLTRLATRPELTLATSGLSPLESDAVVLDAPGHLLVVDQGGLVDIDTTVSPPTAAPRRPLETEGIVPGSLVVFRDHLIIADLRSQESTEESADLRPADLVLVDRSNPSSWIERRLLDGLSQGRNPLITPVAIAVDGPDALLVLDLGLRPLAGESGDPFYKVMAEPSAVYRVSLKNSTDPRGLAVTEIERVTELGRLTRPNGMTMVDGTAYISDPGQLVGADDNPLVRNLPGYFAVQVHFSQQRSVAPADVLSRRKIAHDVASIVDSHKPAAAVAARPHVPTETESGEQPNE